MWADPSQGPESQLISFSTGMLEAWVPRLSSFPTFRHLGYIVRRTNPTHIRSDLMILRRILLALVLIVSSLNPGYARIGPERIQSPEQFLGFRVGEDRKLARWDKIVE